MRGIDKNFFEEVEDLKYALQESAKLNKIYEKTLQGVCKRNKLNYHEILAGVVNRQKKWHLESIYDVIITRVDDVI